jgi:hypothetical protein
LQKVNNELDFDVIVPDNASTDGSSKMIANKFPKVKLIRLKQNLGFAKGNNKARKYCKGKYVLFLNSDTIVYPQTLRKSFEYMEKNEGVGAMTCKMIMGNGEFDKDSRRSFINPWIGFVHLFLRLDRVFPKSRIFGQYWYGYISEDKVHEVDVIEGAYFFTRKKILDAVGWFDESYYLDGENIEICWQIKNRRWKIMYYPRVSITHFKGAAKGKVTSEHRTSVPLKKRLKFRMAGVESMEKFYKRHLWNKYPLVLNILVLLGIKTMRAIRYARTVLLG